MVFSKRFWASSEAFSERFSASSVITENVSTILMSCSIKDFRLSSMKKPVLPYLFNDSRTAVIIIVNPIIPGIMIANKNQRFIKFPHNSSGHYTDFVQKKPSKKGATHQTTY